MECGYTGTGINEIFEVVELAKGRYTQKAENMKAASRNIIGFYKQQDGITDGHGLFFKQKDKVLPLEELSIENGNLIFSLNLPVCIDSGKTEKYLSVGITINYQDDFIFVQLEDEEPAILNPRYVAQGIHEILMNKAFLLFS